ncbi:MAG: hypothetical protein WCS86_02130 [Candidatus Paceibacterota bacterium]
MQSEREKLYAYSTVNNPKKDLVWRRIWGIILLGFIIYICFKTLDPSHVSDARSSLVGFLGIPFEKPTLPFPWQGYLAYGTLLICTPVIFLAGFISEFGIIPFLFLIIIVGCILLIFRKGEIKLYTEVVEASVVQRLENTVALLRQEKDGLALTLSRLQDEQKLFDILSEEISIPDAPYIYEARTLFRVINATIERNNAIGDPNDIEELFVTTSIDGKPVWDFSPKGYVYLWDGGVITLYFPTLRKYLTISVVKHESPSANQKINQFRSA